MMESKYYMGIDIGSVSLNVAIIDQTGNLVFEIYERTNGQPFKALLSAFEKVEKKFHTFHGAAVTGSGKDFLADMLHISRENEIITQARATSFFHPQVRTAIEIGGQDSKIMFFEHDEMTGKTILCDHALNEICAAGTGSFLDQQALRLGISIDKEFSELALRSKKPSKIAGRCSVFAKSDMTHLQQDGVPLEDIISGLCFALARNYLSNLVRGRQIRKPVAFQGGVAANKGVAAAFETLLHLEKGELIIPRHFKIMGAIGAALKVMEKEGPERFCIKTAGETLKSYLNKTSLEEKRNNASLKKLEQKNRYFIKEAARTFNPSKERTACFAGVDIGASSINVILIDEEKHQIAKLYQLKKGTIIESLKSAFKKFSEGIDASINIKAVGITGSGRYFIGEIIGADVIVNEITAQAAAAIDIDPEVDTVFEIGGQDSKYISINSGVVTHFEMNKVCAAGTGSFLQEQAGRLDVKIDNEFSSEAFLSSRPVNLGTKCTVFMESDLIHHQQTGACREDLLSGLSYSIVNNFLEKVVANNDIGDRIFFQGGVAGNQSIAAAFENILGKPVRVPLEHGVTGAYGAAIIAGKQFKEKKFSSRFKGFDISSNTYQIDSFICKLCSNRCEIKKISSSNSKTIFSGGICDRYEKAVEEPGIEPYKNEESGPCYAAKGSGLFEFRENLFKELILTKKEIKSDMPSIGIPNVLMSHEMMPLWAAFFSSLDVNLVLTGRSSTRMINQGLEKVLSETCYPVKIAYGHMLDLMEKQVDYLFLPVIIDLENKHKDVLRSYNCPYVQGLPSMMAAAFAEKTDARFISPTIYIDDLYRNLEQEMLKIGSRFCDDRSKIMKAVEHAKKTQKQFEELRSLRGKEFLDSVGKDENILLIAGKPYNIYDRALNLNIFDKLRKLGIKAIPYDFIDLKDIELPSNYSNLVWKNEQTLLRAAIYSKENHHIFPVIVTNYGCGPDAFSFNYLKDIMGSHPYLMLEVDEHSGDAGLVTRIEAFWDTLENARKKENTIKEKKADLENQGRNSGKKALSVRELDLKVVTSGSFSSYGIYRPSQRCGALKKNIFIFNGSEHSDVWHAAAAASGLKAIQLPMPDDQSHELGKFHTTSRECHPYILLTGDLVKAVNKEGFNPETSAFLMLNYDGSCRMTQYGAAHKLVLKRLGVSQVPVIAPMSSYYNDEVTKLFGVKFSLNLWKGWIATDFLTKKLLNTRPYEVSKGEAQKAYDNAVQDIVAGILNNKFESALKQAARKMEDIKINRVPKPLVGITGEFYSCINPLANNDIINTMEALGVEVRLGTSPSDYLIYFNESYPGVRFKEKKYLKSVYYYIRNTFLKYEKRKIETIFGSSFYAAFHTPAAKARKKLTARYIDPVVDPILAVNVAKAKEYVLDNCSGIANLIVLNCLYGNVTAAIYRQIQRENNSIPVLTMTYDGLKSTNEKTRIEAFIHQVKNYHRNMLLN